MTTYNSGCSFDPCWYDSEAILVSPTSSPNTTTDSDLPSCQNLRSIKSPLTSPYGSDMLKEFPVGSTRYVGRHLVSQLSSIKLHVSHGPLRLQNLTRSDELSPSPLTKTKSGYKFSLMVTTFLGRVYLSLHFLRMLRQLRDPAMTIGWSLSFPTVVSQDSTVMRLARLGDLESLKELFILGKARPSDVLENGRGLLHFAAKAHNIELIGFLLHNGAEINAFDDDGETPLHVQLACTFDGFNATKTSRFLISHGADVMVQSVSGATPSHNFYSPAIESILRFHPEYIDIEAEDEHGLTFFHYMAWSSRSSTKIARLYVEHGAGGALLSARDRAGRIPLHLVAQRGNIPLVAYMLEIMVSKKIELMQADLMGRTAMHYALESKRSGVITLLAEKGVSIHTADSLGRTPLHHAVMQRHVGSLEGLLKLGAIHDLHAVYEKGRTPLHLAQRRKDASEVVRHLLEFGAGQEKTTADMRGRTDRVFEYQYIQRETEADQLEAEGRYCLSPSCRQQMQSTNSGYWRTSRLKVDLVLMILGIFLWKCLKVLIPSLSVSRLHIDFAKKL
ncbi:uncharacterized protein A1O9_06329 [Exophiala aquamarina CBS 119918]|uniref:Uncharacterized protein n=1 Tax=Exophiala aquamarina CBS 119918 TaxID=1182545 RepID=A0A072PGI1_9EURO|nr:uncharacterized protein A1O9_06329 [Exophiala aquamarina CBS 119918]KEF58403.1 hypothetical protein A1O9_06329 [Exophiala aquamarina CBS 119918]